ncbi:n-acetyltransferase-related [Holotrichia oblita]|uniref:N-acetyltransferase-related n=1 Tax=Holotrichia oblita TaxID=644536 RepID=A0ACB9TXE3_HOLOL|nr:n-acetyltransferase-related [Holotrichia oblita]
MEKILLDAGNIKYTQLSAERLEEAIAVGRSFFADEPVCRALEIKSNETAQKELEELFRKAAADGVSIIAIDKATDLIVGVSFNRLLVRDASVTDFYDQYAKRCTEKCSKAFLSFLRDADSMVSFFEYCNTDCYFEIVYLIVLRSHRSRSIGFNLCQVSADLSKILLSGINAKKSITGAHLELKPYAKYLCVVSTSPLTQKLALKFGMKTAGSVKFDQWTYNGRTFAEILNNTDEVIQYSYKKIV